MSGHKRADRIVIDYLQYHKTGEKILKTKRSEKMDLREKKVKEMQICEDIAESLNIYVLDDLETESEISEAIEQVNELGRQFRHVHVELKEEMGERDHGEAYVKYAETCEAIRTFVKSARSKVKGVKKENKDKEEIKFENERKSEAINALKIEEQVFREKLERQITTFEDTENDENDEIKKCAKLEVLLDEYYTLLSRFKIAFGENFENEYKEIFDNTGTRIMENIDLRRKEIKTFNMKAEESIVAGKMKEKLQHESFIKEQIFHSDILAKEIAMRCDSIIKKCDSAELNKMSDHQIFECYKNMSAIDCEMREVFDKISAFAKIASSFGDKGDDMLVQPQNNQKKALKAKDTFFQDLRTILVDRDISEVKLKNACTLNIELEKFRGFGSKLDIYSFKSEFEKLIMPRYQKCYLVDTLKNNYLSGPAYTLVEKVDNIQAIWSKLINTYGNVKLLLQNKINNLEQMESLEKVKGDEKIANAIGKILNMMTELKTLAEKHKLEYKLYVGGGLEKVLTLIGGERERKFLSKNCEKGSSEVSKDVSEVIAEKLEWDKLFDFLTNEQIYREKLTLLQKSKSCLGINPETKNISREKKDKNAFHSIVVEQKCHICGKSDHVISVDKNGKNHVDYFSCKIFVDMSPKERHLELRKKKLCFQCLRPGVKYDEKHICFSKYVCPDSYHQKFPKGLHVLVCDAHKNDQSNINLLEEYKMKVINKKSSKFQNFTKNISLVCVNKFDHVVKNVDFRKGNEKFIPDVRDSAIFMLQTIKVEEKRFNIFYDSGCGDLVIKKSAIDALLKMGRAKLKVPGPIIMSGVGDHKSVCEHGIYSIRLPLKNGFEAVFSGVCLDRVTSIFPKYKLREVERDIKEHCKKQGDISLDTLPKLSREVGGDTEILMGSKYLIYHPQERWKLPSGLTVFDSCFLSADGTSGVVCGPHPSFSKALMKKPAQNGKFDTFSVYTCDVDAYRSAYRVCSEMPLLGEKFDVSREEWTMDNGQWSHENPFQVKTDFVTDVGSGDQLQHGIGRRVGSEFGNLSSVFAAGRAPKCLKIFDEAESAGVEVTYRCVGCRNCLECKRSSRIDSVSIQEEIEQDLINRSVKIDLEKRSTIHMLPFVTNPDTKLPAAEKILRLARRIYDSQINGLENKPGDKEAIIKSEGKLQDHKFVDYLDSLPDDDRAEIVNSPVKYFIAWRAVWNTNSISTPCRLVFDASCCPKGECSLNSILAKGANNMNKLIIILIRWTAHKCAFHTDITKMYNAINLDKKHWKYQLYLWEEKLRVGIEPRWKVIKTAIYGVRSSGNIAECGIRKTAEVTRSEYPEAYDIINNDIYVDDCLSGDQSVSEVCETTDQLNLALSKGGFILKGFTFSGRNPPEHMSSDGESVGVGGLKWASKADLISLKVPELNFNRKNRGRKSTKFDSKIPEKFTKRNCVSRVAEVFDPLGRVAPLISGFKIDIHELSLRKLSWDDEIPENLRQIWVNNFEMIEEINSIKYKRAIIPDDAVDTNIECIDTADASPKMICVAIYARFRRKSGGYSCQLVFARSKIVPEDMSMPRAELLAASINASTGHVVKTAFGKKYQKCLKLTDSQVSLHWIGSTRSRLKMWVRHKVIEINRLTNIDDWRYVDSKNMIADLGTRKGATIADVGPNSEWICGFDWMHGDEIDFPVKTMSELELSSENEREAMKEKIILDVHDGHNELDILVHLPTRYVPTALGDRYSFSRYLIDPNRFRFRKVVSVLGLVILFVSNLLKKRNKSIKLMQCESERSFLSFIKGDKYLITTGQNACKAGLVVKISKDVLHAALKYYFVKATQEVKNFIPESRYKNISVEQNGVLFYTGRILSTQEISGQVTLCDTSFDLSKTSFCVPIADNLSPVAYAVANEIHWYCSDVEHGGVESLLRQTQCTIYIIGGRNLIKSMKKACAQCRLLEKKQVEVAMGPKHENSLCIAPAFHNTQVDICGPFDSYSNSNKRAKVKIWFVVFVCCITGAVDCKTMEDYSTDSFVLAFIRFSCRYGYPCTLYPDPGSQLVKGCKDMVLNFVDIENKLSVEFGVEYVKCPVGAHNVHGKVERKIKQIKRSFEKVLDNQRRSVIQWETLGQQIVNSINNLPIGLGNKTEGLENLDILTPNRLLLGRNNDRGPTEPLILSHDVKKIIATNANIFSTWFKSWLVSYVPTLVEQPKWFKNDRHVCKGDIVLFLRSEKEFGNQYQYGIVSAVYVSKDGHIRAVDVQYRNHNENTTRTTKRGVRDLVVIHHVDEIGINAELYEQSKLASFAFVSGN